MKLNKFKQFAKQIGTQPKGIKVKAGVLNNQAKRADIMMIHEYGTANIPARPVFRPVKQTLSKYDELVKKALLEGKPLKQTMEQIGLAVQGALKEQLVSVNNPPLKKPRKDGGTKPLVDTGLLLSSITYEVLSDV